MGEETKEPILSFKVSGSRERSSLQVVASIKSSGGEKVRPRFRALGNIIQHTCTFSGMASCAGQKSCRENGLLKGNEFITPWPALKDFRICVRSKVQCFVTAALFSVYKCCGRFLFIYFFLIPLFFFNPAIIGSRLLNVTYIRFLCIREMWMLINTELQL